MSPQDIARDAALMQPVTSNEPCGPSLEYDAEFAVLQARLTPGTEAQYGQFVGVPEAPNWAEIERDCRRLMWRTKDINLMVSLCRARTRLAQAGGLVQMLSTLHAMLKAWPEAMHPQRTIDGEPDPAVRANALAALADPDGLLGDVRDIVAATQTVLRLTVRDVERALAPRRAPDALDADAVLQQLHALRVAAAGDPLAPVNLLAQAWRIVGEIEAWIDLHLHDHGPLLKPLTQLLRPFAEPAAPPLVAPTPGALEASARWVSTPGGLQAVAHGAMPATAPFPSNGSAASAASTEPTMSTRDDMLHRIRGARDWFETHEPSSPVAVLLKQAERMVGKRFHEIADAIPLDLLRRWETAEEDSGAAR
ncbi:MAG: type VI secretion system ImpA family N-terminal domain-containing protein [Pseudomonadota bacterium]